MCLLPLVVPADAHPGAAGPPDRVELVDDALASATPGMVGADLRNLVNEAALTAARRNHDTVEMGDLRDHRANLDALARALLEHETLDEDEAYAAAGISRSPARATPAPRRGAD